MRLTKRTDKSKGQHQSLAFIPAQLTAAQEQARQAALRGIIHNVSKIAASGDADVLRAARYLTVSGLQYHLVQNPLDPEAYCLLLDLIWQNLERDWIVHDKYGVAQMLIRHGKKSTKEAEGSEGREDSPAIQVAEEADGRDETEEGAPEEIAGTKKSTASDINEQKRSALFCRAQRRYGRLQGRSDRFRLEVEYITRESAQCDGGKKLPLFIAYLIEDFEITRCVEVSKSSVFGLHSGADVHFIEQLIFYAVEYFARADQGAFVPTGVMGHGFSYQWLVGGA